LPSGTTHRKIVFMRHGTEVTGAERIDFLRTAPLFARLRDDELAFLAQHACCERKPRAATLFHQSAPANEIWLLRRGGVKLVQQQIFGRPIAVRVVGPLGVLGLDVVAQNAAYSVTAETLCWSELLVWTRDIVRRVMEANPSLAVGAMQVLSGRLEDFRSRYRDVSKERAETRLARVLFRAFCEWTRATPPTAGNDGRIDPVDLPLSRRDLADIAGTTLYTASRVVQDLERRGLLRAGRMRVTVLQPTSLPLTSVDGRMRLAKHARAVDTDGFRPSNVLPPS
jgi:CRP-like cAMP-binding protein